MWKQTGRDPSAKGSGENLPQNFQVLTWNFRIKWIFARMAYFLTKRNKMMRIVNKMKTQINSTLLASNRWTSLFQTPKMKRRSTLQIKDQTILSKEYKAMANHWHRNSKFLDQKPLIIRVAKCLTWAAAQRIATRSQIPAATLKILLIDQSPILRVTMTLSSLSFKIRIA